jgi:hypothetical protein
MDPVSQRVKRFISAHGTEQAGPAAGQPPLHPEPLYHLAFQLIATPARKRWRVNGSSPSFCAAERRRLRGLHRVAVLEHKKPPVGAAFCVLELWVRGQDLNL